MIICSWCSFTFTITTIVIKFWRFTISVISKNFVLKRGVPEECTDTRFFPWLNRISSVSDKRVWWFSLWNRISWYSGSFVTFETLRGMLTINSNDWSLMGLVTLLFSSSSEIVIEMFSVCLNNGTKWFGVNGSSVLKFTLDHMMYIAATLCLTSLPYTTRLKHWMPVKWCEHGG